MCPRQQILPPEWWNRDLYNFLNEIPLEGWCWEFMRRAKLKEELAPHPVDAMNSNPDIESINSDCISFYKSWNHQSWFDSERNRIKTPTFISPSVSSPGMWPTSFKGQQYRVEDQELKNLIKVTIDLNRRDTAIIRDFKLALFQLRQRHEQPQRVTPRINDWIGSHILQVWDLREYNVSWNTITEILGFNSISSTRSAFKTAYDHINNTKWIELARYADVEE